MTEREMQRRLWARNHNSFRILLPNYTPLDWWECDLFGVTRAGYFHEFEIKVSLADFRKDLEKRKRDYSNYEWGKPVGQITKHDQLAARFPKGPALFWYCVPEGMISAGDVPEWAGLQVMHHRHHWFQVIKQAPRLHREKIDHKIVQHAMSVCYFRYWKARNDYDRLVADRTKKAEATA